MKSIYLKVIAVFSVLIFFQSCKTTDQDFKSPIVIGGQKEVEIKVNQPKKTPVFFSDKITPQKKIADNLNIISDETIKINTIFSDFELFIPNANVGIMKIVDDNLWIYLEETRKFYDSGWYIFNYKDKSVKKSLRTYFDMDLIQELSPKYNKKEYYYFKKIDFDKIRLYKFNKPVFTWLYSTFKEEIQDTNILCINADEEHQEIWFGFSDKIKKFDMKREIWSEPYSERASSNVFETSEIAEIIVYPDYVWFITFNCNIIIYDKLRDIWKTWKPNDFSCNYMSLVSNDDTYVWFKSDVGIWQYKKLNSEWYEFDLANYLGNKIIKKVLIDEFNNFLIENIDEISYYNRHTDYWEIHKKSNFPAKNRNSENYLNTVYSLAKDNNKIWISTETGFLEYDSLSRKWVINDKKDLNDKFRTDFTHFTELFLDPYYIWIGTDDGLFRLARK
ncbi:hypothetical protein KA977_04810 [Candidatus Dependentiae bacterium]|nr:hypothetical protein [Candidatus Dependentiae bacterium]